MNNNKRNIAIVCGGDSSEHGVSLRSAKGIYDAFDRERYNVYIVVICGQDWHVDLPDGNSMPIDRNDFSFGKGSRRVTFDYVYITIHGTPGENGILQGYLDLLRLPYSTSSVLVEALTFNKYALNNYLRSLGVTVADSILLRRGEPSALSDEQIVERLGLPCFVKPVADGSSFGVTKVKSADQLSAALNNAFGQGNQVMVERFLDGIEVTVGCYKTRDKAVVFPVTEVVTDNEFFDYDAKYNGQVQEITPARISNALTAQLQEQTLRIYDLLHCNGIIRIDYIITKDAGGTDCINLLEINTTPGMTATSFIPQQVRAAGLELKDVLTDIVENQLRTPQNNTAAAEPGNSDSERLVVFGRYENAMDASIAKGVLETNGVTAGVIGDSTANALMMTPMMVVVFERDLERAREIMASLPDEALPVS